MIATAILFEAQEKSLRQAMKGVWYELGAQKHIHESAACDKEESSSKTEDNSDDDDDDDEEEEEDGVTKIKPLKRHKRTH